MSKKKIKTEVIRSIAMKSGNLCVFPSCNIKITDGNKYLGELAHIEAESPNGPRYNKTQTDEERHGEDNLMFMCRTHHGIIDHKDNLLEYTVEKLKEIKADHEKKIEQASLLTEKVIDKITKKERSILKKSTAPIFLNSIKFEEWLSGIFRNKNQIKDFMACLIGVLDKLYGIKKKTREVVFLMVYYADPQDGGLKDLLLLHEYTEEIEFEEYLQVVERIYQLDIIEDIREYDLMEKVHDLNEAVDYKLKKGTWRLTRQFRLLLILKKFILDCFDDEVKAKETLYSVVVEKNINIINELK